MNDTSVLSYQDITLVPQESVLRSRSEANLSIKFLGREFAAPWLPANMTSVVNEDICKWLSENNYPYIYHRFGDTRKFIQRARAEAWKFVSISVGVKDEDKALIADIASSKCRVHWITIDIAHGHSILMREMIQFIGNLLPDVKIIAGNVTTPDATRDLASWGADAVKCGVGGGAACSTKNMTGFHVPMFTCTLNCSSHSPVPIILDGGVRENGDFAKALVAAQGCPSLVMAGSLFAACIDAPGENIYDRDDPMLDKHMHQSEKDWQNYLTNRIPIAKGYHGSASSKQKGDKKHVEGFELQIPCNGLTYVEKYQELRESLSSSISYAGGSDLSCFAEVEYLTYARSVIH